MLLNVWYLSKFIEQLHRPETMEDYRRLARKYVMAALEYMSFDSGSGDRAVPGRVLSLVPMGMSIKHRLDDAEEPEVAEVFLGITAAKVSRYNDMADACSMLSEHPEVDKELQNIYKEILKRAKEIEKLK